MAKVELHESSEPASESPETVSQTAGSLLMSVAFWLALLAAAAMYAAVALSPKLADWVNVRQHYLSNAERLKQLEDEVDYLERVATALKSDPEFAIRLVRANQDPRSSDSEFVPVANDLVFSGGQQVAVTQPQVLQPRLVNLIFHLASHRQHRHWLLITSASLTLVAFTLFNDTGVGIVRITLNASAAIVSATTSRYRKPKPPEPVFDPDVESADH
jgi:hypothetical protein